MILRSQHIPSQASGFAPAWQVVARTQKTNAEDYYLVRQPDHARLAGQIAEQFAIPGAPAVEDDILRGISLHDEGWSDVDTGRQRLRATPARYSDTNVPLNQEGKPLSFLEVKAEDFLRAWRGSIESAEAIAPVAGLMVSGHFRRIGEFGMTTGTYSDDDRQQVREFIASEEGRERRLLVLQNLTEREIEYWIDVLQFCDLLSLYLCCGSRESVEFPQRIVPGGETTRLQVQDGTYVLSPSPVAQKVELSVEAFPYPAAASGVSATLRWRLR